MKYKELVREANRDDKTLVELENKLRSIELRQAKLEDPWELITSPTISNIPVAPNKTLITFVGTLIGFVLGFIISVIKEKKAGFIFEEDILESLFKIKILDDIDLNNLNSKSLVNKLFIKDIFIQNKDKSFKFYYSNYLYRLDPKSLVMFGKMFSKNIELLESKAISGIWGSCLESNTASLNFMKGKGLDDNKLCESYPEPIFVNVKHF